MEKQLAAAPPRTSPEHRLTVTVIIILGMFFAGIIALAYVAFMLLLRLITAVHGGGVG